MPLSRNRLDELSEIGNTDHGSLWAGISGRHNHTVSGPLMEKEIRSQPRLLADSADSYLDQAQEILKDRKFDMVLLAARGSSDHAALFARYLIEIHLGIPVSLAAPSVLTKYHSHVKYENCLGIGISQSGAAPDVAEVMKDLRDSGNLTIAITNTDNSNLETSSSATINLNLGDEKSVAATKTYTASLLVLYQIVQALGGGLPEAYDNLPTDAWCNEAASWAAKNSEEVDHAHPVFTLARGYSYCTAQEAALKLMECALVAAKSYSTADFQHGPRALARNGSCAIVAGDAPSGLQQQGCEVVKLPSANVEEVLQPLWEIIPAQWLALNVARKRGLNPDDPQHIHKITRTL